MVPGAASRARAPAVNPAGRPGGAERASCLWSAFGETLWLTVLDILTFLGAAAYAAVYLPSRERERDEPEPVGFSTSSHEADRLDRDTGHRRYLGEGLP